MPLGERAVRDAAAALVPGGRVRSLAPIGADEGAPGVARKAAGYAAAWRVEVEEAGGAVRPLAFRTSLPDEFGHDRRPDRFAQALLAYESYGRIPGHVRALDVGALAPEGLRSLRDAGEPYLVTEWVDGVLYADDLRRVARQGEAGALDVERAAALASYLVALHAEPIASPAPAPVAWRRALRDLVGSGEGVFGIADAYPDGVEGAPRGRLARLEERCLAWRQRLLPRHDRLRRTHGDFHPFNLLFVEGTRLAVLDASRGCAGDPADDVTALAVNYVLFGLEAPRAWHPGFARLWRRFWDVYLDAPGAGEVLTTLAPWLAWRALVLACPRFYPALAAAGRDALLGLAERALDAAAFDPRWAEELFR
jgi:aminoglycoside phosphotransferase (APT) family kinase protein